MIDSGRQEGFVNHFYFGGFRAAFHLCPEGPRFLNKQWQIKRKQTQKKVDSTGIRAINPGDREENRVPGLKK